MARRRLRMGPEEWDALPWWEQRLIVEGYEQEGLIGNPDEQPGASASGDEDWDSFVGSGDLGEFAALGFREQTVSV